MSSLASWTTVAGKTSSKLSIVANSGNSIRSLLLANSPAAMIPTKPPKKNISPFRLFLPFSFRLLPAVVET